MIPADLIAFEQEVAAAFEAKKIRGPVHLSGGNEEPLIEIFKNVPRNAWVLSTWRSHYHALLHGVPREKVMAQIMEGRSMNLAFPEHRFLTSAIVGGCLPIACGLAAAGEQVWCFIGDMAATTGTYSDARHYDECNRLGVNFIIEDNGLSTNTPTLKAWGPHAGKILNVAYSYERTYPHTGTGKYVPF